MQASTLQFLKKLRKNNSRDWFEKNRTFYEEARADFLIFVDEVIENCKKVDPALSQLTAKDCVFRIYRDVRFSHDKTPYKSNFSAQLKAGGKKSTNCGIYIHIEPDGKEGSFLAGGYWMPETPILKTIRQEIEYNTDDFKSILKSTGFKKTFGEMEPHKLSRVPKGIDKDHPDAELLKHVSFIVSREITTEELLGNSLAKNIARDYVIMKPFLDFLNRAQD